MKSRMLVLALVIGCTPARMAVPPQMAASSDELRVTEKPGFFAGDTLKFGPYRAREIHQGWTVEDRLEVNRFFHTDKGQSFGFRLFLDEAPRQQNCAALGRAGMGWTWPGNHPASLVTSAYPTVWNNPSARKPKLLVFQGEADGAVTPENMADIVQQFTGALGIPATPANSALGIPTTLKGHDYTVYARGSEIMLATIFMHRIGHGTPVDPGSGPDQGGWDPITSLTMVNDPNAVQDWTNTAGIYGPYYAAKFWGIAP